MISRCSPEAIIRSYSLLTIRAPRAVSSTSAKPRAVRARRISARPDTGKSAMKDGARLTTTGRPEAISALARAVSERISLALWGQTT